MVVMETDADFVLEEGEITDSSSDAEELYTPLERPADYSRSVGAGRFTSQTSHEPQTHYSESDEPASSSESDSDADSKATKAKRPKLKPVAAKRPLLKRTAGGRKQNDIWSTRAQEDVLLQNLINCDVSNVDRSRSVEAYPVRGLLPLERTGNKRTFRDRRDDKIRLYQPEREEEDEVKGVPRLIMDLAVGDQSEDADIAKDMANKLYEEKEELILTILRVVGKEKAFGYFKEAKRIEEAGGMPIMNQTRRRTPGGVFFFLVKHDHELTRKQLDEIFEQDRAKLKRLIKEKRQKKVQKYKSSLIKSESGSLPELLTRAELCLKQKLYQGKDEIETGEVDVRNPPPSPVTDGGDGTDTVNNEDRRAEDEYEADFLDLGCGNDMDLF